MRRSEPSRNTRVWVNKRIDASFADWCFGVRSCLSPERTDPTTRVEDLWDPDGAAMIGLSVRTLFDLWLSAQEWNRGDRIIFTALTIADMPRIAREHGLEVAAVDIDPITAEPDLAMLRSLIDDRTRAVVYTHLFGTRGDVTGAQQIAKERGVSFVEDCAEAYSGLSWRGHPDSDLALFSFGPIKTATAFGGALAHIPDRSTRAKMRLRGARLPELPRPEYIGRLFKYGAMMAVQRPLVFGWVARALNRAGGHDQVLNRLSRSFPEPEFFERIRRRPGRPLVLMLERRLLQGDAPVARRTGPALRLVNGLQCVPTPTAGSRAHSYWLVPVLAADPDALIRRLAAAGYHATKGRAFAVVGHGPGVSARAPAGAADLYDHAVYLPFVPEMPESVLDDIARLVLDELAAQPYPIAEEIAS